LFWFRGKAGDDIGGKRIDRDNRRRRT